MSRFIPPHPKKGSAEAKAWGARMRALRGTGKRRRKKNPGSAWHEREAGHAHKMVRTTPDNDEKVFYAGVESAHRVSASAAQKMRMNPDLAQYLGQEGWRPLGKKNVLAFARAVGPLFQVLQKEARAWRVLYRTVMTAPSDSAISLGTYLTLTRALIAANRQANDWMNKRYPLHPPVKRNPIAIYGNPKPRRTTPKNVCSPVAGIIYQNAVEIRAEKTSRMKGPYKHPFGSGVQILGLDNGDVVLHHTGGKKLWISRKDHERNSR